MTVSSALTALALTLAAGGAGQDDRRSNVTVPPGGQVDIVPLENSVSAAQVAPPRRTGRVEQPDRDAARRSTAVQVAPTRGTAEAQPQITREGPGASGSPQLARTAPSAAAPSSPATRADGRRTEIVRVGGSDRCDPQAASARDARCGDVIETRSAEFQSLRAPVLSPEQRLLLDQERGELRGVRAAAQRVARNDVDPGALDTQTLAAISLDRPAEPTPPGVPDPATSPAAEAIIRIIEAAQSMTPKL